MTTKLETYLSTNKIDPRRLALASREIELLTPECRALKTKKAAIKGGKMDKSEEISKAKPRSGRPLSVPAIHKAMAGQLVSGPTKNRVVRAVNSMLSAKKKGEVTFRDLF